MLKDTASALLTAMDGLMPSELRMTKAKPFPAVKREWIKKCV